ncbi:MAG: AAA family ATPase [Acidobacteriota bacterium]|nr:AAA family ATPase [Acidobacteriota bacterium]
MTVDSIERKCLKRVSVVGTSCSGKTTFAKNLARILNVEHVELDAINWLPNWVERPKDEFLSMVEKAAANDAWVFDGNYTRTREIVWRRATTIVWLNYSFPRTFYRALNRTTHRVFTGERIYSGNRETFSKAFLSRDSILLWVLTTYHEKRRRYLKLLREDKLSEKEIFIFRHPSQAEEFLRQVEQIKY